MVAYASSAFAGQVTTNDLSGRWTLTLKCSKAPDGALPYTHVFDVNVKEGMLDGDYVVPGKNNGHFHLNGPIRSDGSAYLHMSGETGQSEYNLKRVSPGSPINFDLDVKFTASQGKGSRVQDRPCDATFSRTLDDFDRALAVTGGDRNPYWMDKAKADRDQAIVALTTPQAPASAQSPPAAISAQYGRRVALVVANGAYRDATLANPGKDADLVKASLERVGFSVTVGRDLTLDGFEQAIGDFADDARGAEVALFYFAGHGFSIASGGRQENLLMGTDADFRAKTGFGLQRGGEPLERVEEVIIGHARATLVFIDACRNIPAVASRGVGGRGFAPIDASAFDGAFVVISTRQGKTADDGVAGQGSPFARAFAEVLPTPKLRIEDAYARIREKVRAETGEEVPDLIRSDLPEGGLVLMPANPQ
jgi:Caspase domain